MINQLKESRGDFIAPEKPSTPALSLCFTFHFWKFKYKKRLN